MLDTSVVVVGASAGGVESLRRLVSQLPPDLAAAVAVVLHVSPTSKSMLAAILSRSGPLDAHQAVDGEPVQPGAIVVAQPDHHLVIEDGRYRVVRGPTENSSRPAIDPLFRSAARRYGNRTVGVVLSGLLDDGTAGLFEVKRRGGWTMVQDPLDALHPDMPLSALEHVNVDIVADSDALGRHIARVVREGPRKAADQPPGTESDDAGRQVPSGMSCPDCSGQLWEFDDDEPLRYRCRVGHEWTGKALVAGSSPRRSGRPQSDMVNETGTVERTDGTKDRLCRYRDTRHRELRDELVLDFRWLAHYCANRFAGRGEPLDDLVQVAQLGLLKAIERYDPDYGVSFPGFAVPTMVGEIKRHFRDATWTVRVPRRASDLLVNLGPAVEALSQTLHRAPTVAELARHLRVSEDDVLAALEARQTYRMQPLTPPSDSDDGIDRRLPSTEDGDLDPTRLTIRLAIGELSDEDQRIVYLRFYAGLTQAEIADEIGTSQVQISRRLRRILRRLEADLQPDKRAEPA